MKPVATRPISPVMARLWGAVSFRMTVIYGLLVLLTTLILLAFIYFQVMGVLQTQSGRLMGESTQRLLHVYEESGRAGLIKTIEQRTIESNASVFLLIDEHGYQLAGNLDRMPSLPLYDSDTVATEIYRKGQKATANISVQALSDGATLIVGRDLKELDDVMLLIRQGMLAVIVVAFLLVMLGTYVFQQELKYRVSTIRQIAGKIGAGQLSQRIPLAQDSDEFSGLNNDINTMLDRIESLMKGARHISDTIAHNLRTPLMRVVGRLRMAQQPERSLNEVRDIVEFAIDEINSLNTLFGKLLQIAEIEASVQRQAFQRCDLSIMAADVVDMYDAFAEDKGLSISLTVEDQVWAPGDPDLLASALANLLDNALKYARKNVSVTVSRMSTREVCMQVQDDGPGVPPDELDKVGQHFYRMDPSTEGHGLGLTSVLAIVNLHRGELVLSDATPGLVATLCLPSRSYNMTKL